MNQKTPDGKWTCLNCGRECDGSELDKNNRVGGGWLCPRCKHSCIRSEFVEHVTIRADI